MLRDITHIRSGSLNIRIKPAIDRTGNYFLTEDRARMNSHL